MAITPTNNTNKNFNSFEILPEDALYSIFSFLPKAKDVLSVLLTNRRFSTFVSTSQPLWHNLLSSHFPLFSPPLPVLANPKEAYKQRKFQEKNIHENKFRNRILNGHTKGAVTCLTIEENILLSGSTDRTIRIKDLTTGKEKIIQTDHAINCFAVQGNLICTGSYDDNFIGIWNLKNGKKLHTLEGHQDGVRCLAVHDGKLISGSMDRSIKIWNPKTGKVLHSLDQANAGEIRSIAIQDNVLYSSSHQNITAWNLETKENLFSFKAIELPDTWINCIAVRGNILFSGQSDGRIKMWNLENRKEMKIFTARSPVRNLLTVPGNILFASFSDGSLQAWNYLVEEGKRLLDIKAHNDWVNCSTLKDGVLYSGSYDQKIKAWDFNFPSLTPYNEKTLEENLSFLEQISRAVEAGLTQEAKTIAQKLHPDFQERLRQHGFKCTGSFQITKKVIARVQIELRLELLLDRLHGKDQEKVSQVLDQIEKINESDKSIYWYFCDIILGGNGQMEPSAAKEAFLADQPYAISLGTKETAVINFKNDLKKLWGPDMSLLLVDLGIIYDEEYSQKLQCSPDILAKVGILSLTDLQALGLLCVPPLAHIVLPTEIPGQEKSAQLGAKRKVVIDLLDKISEEIQKRRQECDHFGVILFTDENGNSIGQELSPWALFQKQFEEIKKQIEEICSSPKNLVNDNGELLAKANALIDQFNATEREYQIAKLHAYIQQPLIQEKWASLLDTTSLADYAQKNPTAKLFEMGAQLDVTSAD